jgi:predicted metal-binding membrane protein
MILTFAAAQARRDRNVAVPTWMFVAGYILVWGYAGVVVFVLVHAGKDLVDRLAWSLALGVTLTLAGLYQFTPLKRPWPLWSSIGATAGRARSKWDVGTASTA